MTTDVKTETIEVRREPLVRLIEAVKRHIRSHGGADNGNRELSAALDGVVRDFASAELHDQLDRPLPAVGRAVAAEELDGG